MAMPDQPPFNRNDRSDRHESWAVRITPREIYDSVMKLTGRVDSALDQLKDIREDTKDHEERLRLLEKSRWPLTSLTVIIALGALVVSILNLISNTN